MEFDKQENGNLVFRNENESFTFVDMGSYVGHQFRKWNEEPSNCWRLMFYDEKKGNSPIHIEALVDSTGYYSKIMVCQGHNRRILLLNGLVVDEDKIYEFDPKDSTFPKSIYIAFEDEYGTKKHPNLNTYLSQKHQFVSSNGESYSGDINSNNYIIRFFMFNEELSKLIDSQNISKHK